MGPRIIIIIVVGERELRNIFRVNERHADCTQRTSPVFFSYSTGCSICKMKTVDSQPRSSLAPGLAPSLAPRLVPSLSTSPLDTVLFFFQTRYFPANGDATLNAFHPRFTQSFSRHRGIGAAHGAPVQITAAVHRHADRCLKNQSIPVEADGSLSRCIRYQTPLDAANTAGNRTAVFCSAWEYNLTSSGQSIVSQWNL